MQSADEEWEDEDWEDYDEDSGFSGMSLSFGIKPVLATTFVIFIIICAMVFQNFGFYFGAGNLTVLIDVNEGMDPGDRTLDANIWATSPPLGMLAKEGDYSIHFDGAKQASGKFDLTDEGRGSIEIDYEKFFVTNGDYTMKVELGGQSSSSVITLDRFADSVSGSVSNFDGDYPLDKDSPVIINMQFTAENAQTTFINPWVSGTVKVYHYEKGFNENQGASYWNDDSERGDTVDNWNLVDTIQLDVNSDSGTYSYSAGGTTDFYAVEIPPYNLNLIIDVDKFYDEEGSGDYTLVFDFSNDFGDDTLNKEGRSSWAWFHICETKSNGKCDGNQ